MTMFGKLLSDRTYGIEIETGFQNESGFHYAVGNIPWRATRDGSLTCKLPVEIVSPILTGQRGIDELRAVCDILKVNGANPDHPSCSVHVHLGVPEIKTTTEYLCLSESEYQKIPKEEIVGACFVPFRVVRTLVRKKDSLPSPLGKKDYERLSGSLPYKVMSGNEPYHYDSRNGKIVFMIARDGVNYLFEMKNSEYDEISEEFTTDSEDGDWSVDREGENQAIMSKYKELPGKYFVKRQKVSGLEELKRIFYFYTLFSDVHRAMVQDSRKVANAYCMALDEAFELDKIENLSSIQEAQAYWYKCKPSSVNSRTSNHYDDSRYHEVNLHSIWNRHGTVEIRTLAGTIDWRKIALWTVLHQRIIDKCVSGELTIEQMRGAVSIKDLRDKVIYFLDILELEENIDLYVRRLVSYFNSFKQKL